MTSREAYKRFLLKTNKNDSNAGINILPSHFVLEYNIEKFVWLGEKIKKNSDNQDIENISDVLVLDKPLKIIKTYTDSVDFTLPDDFYRHVSSYTLATYSCCKNIKIYNFEKQIIGYNTSLISSSKPNFEFEEAPMIIGNKIMKVFTDNYKVDSGFLSYYKIPADIDISGYKKLDGSFSKDQNPDLVDDNVNEILNRMSVENFRKYQDQENIAFSKDRVGTEK